MAEGGESKIESSQVKETTKCKNWIVPFLRLICFSATASATLVMALNKQTRTIVVATIGSSPITATITAKFQHTPAFVFFVIANGIASLHNLLILSITFGNLLSFKIFQAQYLIIAILDMINVALVSGGASAAAFMGELGKNGNKHTMWNKICDKFDTFCDHAGGALIASFAGLLLLIVISALSIAKLRTLEFPPKKSVAP
ncbi:CASP-like protein 1B2 [Impatiens glandulifera]|uniref:CASP-like protein 1B2 n=1 Tax=Impatiens glandulifera TaxID=253017 RepID=UPI001FB05242|nr:CASP-like protein 1B2 [Impatiens glandulifera]